ncbi:MAG: phosphatase PAP2 family protein [Cryomorphaceae bacterium]|nr:MAG: phosphatase PAP2 family protein [Cryomorphaceae bacterium]
MSTQKLARTLVDNRWFVIPYLLYLAMGAAAMQFWRKEELFLFFNSNRANWADGFFALYTHVGDGLFFLVVITLLTLIQLGRGALGAATFAASGLTVLFLKFLIFPDALRPLGFFGSSEFVETAQHIELAVFNSFPSGHASTAFAMFLMLAMMSRKNYLGFLFFLAALLVNYSRVYLGQHFFEDVYFGSIIGATAAVVIRLTCGHWMEQTWAQKSLLRKG